MLIILRYLKPYRVTILFIIILTFAQVLADLLLPNFMARIVNEGIAGSNPTIIWGLGGIMLLVSFLGIASAVVAGFLSSKVAVGAGRDLRLSLFRHVTSYSQTEFDKLGTASLITRTTNDVQQIQNTTFTMLRMMMRAPIMCIGGIIMAVGKDKHLSLILLSILPFIIGIILLVTKRAMPLFRKLQKRLDKLNLVLRESLVGIRIIRAFGRESYEKKRFGNANTDLTNTSIRVNRILAILGPSMVFAMNVITIAIVWFASFQIDGGQLMVGDMMAFIQYAMQIFMSLAMLTMLFVMIPRAFASAERIEEVLETKPLVADPNASVEAVAQKGYVAFNNVSFRYEGAENNAVCKVSFTVNPGETVAIIGGTGAGKSTLVNLIPRYYDVCEGSVTVDGVDVRDMQQEVLRNKIGLVPQKAILFSGSVAENIRFGKRDATDDEIRHACEVAQASEFITNLPSTYGYMVAQDGTNLSGGQKQRLCIARAVVRKPEIYIFDDSFSALDFKTDAELQAALKKETHDAAVIIVAQRVASIMHADRILVMDKGEVVGIGTHSELVVSNDIYREIVESQLMKEEQA